jgi:hypothetical protein
VTKTFNLYRSIPDSKWTSGGTTYNICKERKKVEVLFISMSQKRITAEAVHLYLSLLIYHSRSASNDTSSVSSLNGYKALPTHDRSMNGRHVITQQVGLKMDGHIRGTHAVR